MALNRLSEVVNVPVTKSDKSRLVELAAAKGITLAQLIRGIVFAEERQPSVAA
jgi:hypothetical protein